MRKYLVGGIAIGILQVVDAAISVAHISAAERAGLVFSGVEVVWAIVSLVVCFRVKHARTRLLALAFFGYVAIGWLLAVSFMSPYAPITPPTWSVMLGGLFGCAYAGGSGYVLSRKKPGKLRDRGS